MILTYRVARFFNLDPEVVENWTNADFLDRCEFMFIQEHVDKLEYDRAKAGK
jgi:hypothetical protein